MAAVAVVALAAAIFAWRSGGGAGENTAVTNLQTQSADSPGSLSHALIGKPMPEVSLPGLDGKVHPLSEYRGKTIVLTYWTTW